MSVHVIISKTQVFKLPEGENDTGNQFDSVEVLILKTT
jgi:hypothetical protein